MINKPFGNYCHKHGKGMFSRCQNCIDELVALGVHADKDRIAELERENERLRKDAERLEWLLSDFGMRCSAVFREWDGASDLRPAIDVSRGAK